MSMILLFAAAASTLTPGQEAVQSYHDCLTPLVIAHDEKSERNHIPLEELDAQIKRECARERLAARDALGTYVASTILVSEGRRLPAGDEWKEDLINEATVRWINGVTARSLAEEHEKK